MHLPTERVLRILELVCREPGGLRLSDFSGQLEIPKSTLVPILQTLCARRFLHQLPGGFYTAGTALFGLGAGFSDLFPLNDCLRRELEVLVERFGETCYCGTLEEGRVLYLQKVDSTQPLRMLTSPGKRLPAYATGLGKALLMEKSRQELEALYSGGMEALTANTLTSVDDLWQQLLQARELGYTWEVEESTAHIRCFAVPVRKAGRIVCAVSMAIPLFRWQPEEQPAIIAALTDSAQRIGNMLEKTDAHFGEAF